VEIAFLCVPSSPFSHEVPVMPSDKRAVRARGALATPLAGLFLMFAVLLIMARPAEATPIQVATIDGCYDCVVGDTSSLMIENTFVAGYAFINGTLTLTGYQGLNNGVVQSISLPVIASGVTLTYTWNGSTTAGNLFASDYDDEYNGTFTPVTGFGLASKGPNVLVAAPQCATQSNIFGWNYCADTGNYVVTFTATMSGVGALNGDAIFAQFSPTTNKTGGFLGFEGVDQNGWSETTFDQHSGSNSTVNGGLADIFVGTPPTGAVPEPATLTLLGSGLLGLAGRVRNRLKKR
jgi:hypothetical protein